MFFGTMSTTQTNVQNNKEEADNDDDDDQNGSTNECVGF